VIKPEWVTQFALKQQNSELIKMPAKGHIEGWGVYRQEIMSMIEAALYEIDTQ
jgi:hypothetical protein